MLKNGWQYTRRPTKSGTVPHFPDHPITCLKSGAAPRKSETGTENGTGNEGLKEVYRSFCSRGQDADFVQ
jgi:hypothetical protein